MLRRKCSQGTLTQSKRHVMARVNYLQEHLLSYCSINLCSGGLSSPLLCSSCRTALPDSSQPPAICAGQEWFWREKRIFSLSPTSRQCQTVQRVSLDLFPVSQSFLSCPFPSVPLPFPPFLQAQDHTTPSATVQTLGLCSHSHQGSQGPLCPPYSCRRKGWIKEMWNHTHSWKILSWQAPTLLPGSARPPLQGQGFVLSRDLKKTFLNFGGVKHKKEINNICSS